MPGVLYFITSYRRPEQVLRLAKTLSEESPSAEILIHHDRFRSSLEADQVTGVAPRAHLVRSPVPLAWGDFSVVDMHWRCYEWALDELEFDWMIMLSEQDYPVWPLDRTERLLRGSGADAFMKAEKVDPEVQGPYALAFNRYFFSYAALPGAAALHRVPAPWIRSARRWRQRAVDRVNRRPAPRVRAETYPDGMPTRFGVRRRATPFSASFPCWVGNAWFALSRRAVTEVVAFTGAHGSYRRYYERTVVPEESATLSIVANSPDLRVVGDNLRYERWSDPHSGHPDVLGHDDLDQILAADTPFARKFDIGTDRSVLDHLDGARQRG